MRRALALLAALALVAAWLWRLPPRAAPTTRVELAPAVPPAFARALEPRAFELPRDHGPHPEFQTEWWYYTGNLRSAQDRHYGFQLTFFRRGLAPGEERDGSLRTRQVYFAHFALTDVAAGRHRFAERFARGAGALAGAASGPFGVWLEDWQVEALDADASALRLRARDAGLALDLRLEARKPLVAHGDRGLSPKSTEPGNASFYLSYTRLAASGTLATAGGAPVAVEGQAWFDHEWSSSALAAGALGWDWFSLQTDDGRELMYFQIRREGGTLEPVSGGTLVEADGRTRRIAASDVRLEVVRHWTSPESGVPYPAGWRLSLPGEGLELRIEPWLAAQEMRTSFTYWEGAVRVEGLRQGQALSGQGYVELTGYGKSMRGVF